MKWNVNVIRRMLGDKKTQGNEAAGNEATAGGGESNEINNMKPEKTSETVKILVIIADFQ